MIIRLMLAILLIIYGTTAAALFCSKTFSNVNVGMTMEQVEAACGPPLSKEESLKPLQRKVPLTQLSYNNAGSKPAQPTALTPVSPYYGIWANSQDIRGEMMQVDIVDEKVYAVKIDGTDQNAFSICGGYQIKIGDPASQVFASCGPPLLVNKTFIIENILDAPKPEVWVYQMDQFQPAVRLTFTNGTLQSIE